jgi:hypothetical protein
MRGPINSSFCPQNTRFQNVRTRLKLRREELGLIGVMEVGIDAVPVSCVFFRCRRCTSDRLTRIYDLRPAVDNTGNALPGCTGGSRHLSLLPQWWLATLPTYTCPRTRCSVACVT